MHHSLLILKTDLNDFYLTTSKQTKMKSVVIVKDAARANLHIDMLNDMKATQIVRCIRDMKNRCMTAE